MVILIGGLAVVRSKNGGGLREAIIQAVSPIRPTSLPWIADRVLFSGFLLEARHLSLLSRPQTWAGLLAGPFFCLSGGRIARRRTDKKFPSPALTFFAPL
jgi:hypothetical protein